MTRTSVALWVMLPALTVAAEWTPPEKPDPTQILREAQADARAQRYEDALAKHLWYHHHALKHQPSQYGVRLSFALSDWKELGKAYPPALAALKTVRDDAEKSIQAGGDIHAIFHDFKSLNETLGETEKTTAAFVALEQRDREAAKKVYPLAQPALIESREYRRCGEYLTPKRTVANSQRIWELDTTVPDNPPGRAALRRSAAEHQLINQMAPLVALLILNDRKAEAEETARAARQICDHEAVVAALEQALQGEFPARR